MSDTLEPSGNSGTPTPENKGKARRVASQVADKVDGVRHVGEEKVARARSRSWLVERSAATYEGFRDSHGGECAAGLAYYGFLSVYPMLVTAASIMAIFIKDPERVEHFMNQMIGRISPGLVPLVAGSTDVISDSAAPLGLIATVLFLWSAFKVIQVTQQRLSRIFGVDDRTFLKAFGSRVTFAALAMVGPVVLMLASFILSRQGPRRAARGAAQSGPGPGRFIAYLVIVFLVDLVLAIVAMKIVGGYKGRNAPLFQGAAVTAGGWFLLQTLGVFLVQRLFTSWAMTFYGVAASNIAMLIIANFGSRALLYGALWAATAPENQPPPADAWPRTADAGLAAAGANEELA